MDDVVTELDPEIESVQYIVILNVNIQKVRYLIQ